MKKYLPILKSCLLFDRMQDNDILTSLSCMGAQIISKENGDYILYAGETTDSINLIVSGTVFVIQEDLWGNRNMIAKLTTGDFFCGSLCRNSQFCFKYKRDCRGKM